MPDSPKDLSSTDIEKKGRIIVGTSCTAGYPSIHARARSSVYLRFKSSNLKS